MGGCRKHASFLLRVNFKTKIIVFIHRKKQQHNRSWFCRIENILEINLSRFLKPDKIPPNLLKIDVQRLITAIVGNLVDTLKPGLRLEPSSRVTFFALFSFLSFLKNHPKLCTVRRVTLETFGVTF